MSRDWRSQHNFGVSWGFPGLRIGRSEYGTWWVSIGLPFGFRITKRLGRSKDPLSGPVNSVSGQVTLPPPVELPQAKDPTQVASSAVISKNREVLERMKKLS
jgi:hypothetical protein